MNSTCRCSLSFSCAPIQFVELEGIGLCRSEASAATVFRALQTHAERVALGPACPSMAGMARPASRAARECGMALSTRHRATQAYPLRDPSNSRPRTMSYVDSRRDRPSWLGGHRYSRNVIAIGRCVRPNATHASSGRDQSSVRRASEDLIQSGPISSEEPLSCMATARELSGSS